MEYQHLLEEANEFTKQELGNDASGHDWWHSYRVAKTAKAIAFEEGADLFICEMAAWLHDIADEKLNDSKEEGLQKVEAWLQEKQVDAKFIIAIMEIISTMSYSGGSNPPVRTIEGQVVQDADRIDAIGAMGIARVFAYAGWKGHLLYDPTVKPREEMTKEQYRNEKNTAINHFYEKLLKLKDTMNTQYAKKLAEERHQFMQQYLHQFYAEWEGMK